LPDALKPTIVRELLPDILFIVRPTISFRFSCAEKRTIHKKRLTLLLFLVLVLVLEISAKD
jgi:hypothetical protein